LADLEAEREKLAKEVERMQKKAALLSKRALPLRNGKTARLRQRIKPLNVFIMS